jgi:hypothetical protein
MISDFSFGRIVANGQTCNTDIKIIQGTHVRDVLDTELEILVIGKGQPGYMRVSESLREHLAEKNVTLIEEPTAKAIETFNRLFKEGQRICGGFHVGC